MEQREYAREADERKITFYASLVWSHLRQQVEEAQALQVLPNGAKQPAAAKRRGTTHSDAAQASACGGAQAPRTPLQHPADPNKAGG